MGELVRLTVLELHRKGEGMHMLTDEQRQRELAQRDGAEEAGTDELPGADPPVLRHTAPAESADNIDRSGQCRCRQSRCSLSSANLRAMLNTARALWRAPCSPPWLTTSPRGPLWTPKSLCVKRRCPSST